MRNNVHFNKSYLAMVTPQTLSIHTNSKFLATGANELGEKWVKTLWDLLSDILSLRQGDLVYFLRYQSERREAESILGQWEVSGSALFDERNWCSTLENYVFRVKLEENKKWGYYLPTDYIFSQPRDFGYLWSLGGKKALGRGKSLTSLPAGAEKALDNLLERFEKEEDWKKEKFDDSFQGRKAEEYREGEKSLRLDEDWFFGLFENEQNNNPTKPTKLTSDVIESLPVANSENLLIFEKVLEAWFSMFIDKDPLKSFWEDLGLDQDKILWFSNYLPLTVSGKNADFVILLDDGEENGTVNYNLVVIELKRDYLYGKRGYPSSTLKEGINEVERYSRILKNLFRGNLQLLFADPEVDIKVNVKKVVVGAKNPNTNKIKQATIGDVNVFTYEITSDKPPIKIEKVG